MNLKQPLEDALIVSVSFHPGDDTGVLIVGRQKKDEGIKLSMCFGVPRLENYMTG